MPPLPLPWSRSPACAPPTLQFSRRTSAGLQFAIVSKTWGCRTPACLPHAACVPCAHSLPDCPARSEAPWRPLPSTMPTTCHGLPFCAGMAKWRPSERHAKSAAPPTCPAASSTRQRRWVQAVLAASCRGEPGAGLWGRGHRGLGTAACVVPAGRPPVRVVLPPALVCQCVFCCRRSGAAAVHARRQPWPGWGEPAGAAQPLAARQLPLRLQRAPAVCCAWTPCLWAPHPTHPPPHTHTLPHPSPPPQPCPMCYTACMWAHIEHVYYGATYEDVLQYGK